MSKLFEPAIIGTLRLRNRTVMAPMTRRMSPQGLPGADVAAYYQRRADGGVGLIVSEGLAIDDPASIHNPNVPRIFGDDALTAWARIARAVQAAGAAFIPQLWHTGGARTKYEDVVNPAARSISASGVYFPDMPYGEPATEAEIEAAVLSYGRGARAAMATGCDGVNIHAGHGYLIDSFLWSRTNLRSDGYGMPNRTRFAAEVIAECRRQTRPDFPIMFRFSQFKEQEYEARLCRTPADLDAMLGALVDAGVDIFDCSTRRFWAPEFGGSDLSLAGWTRKLSGTPTMAVGSVGLDSDVIAALHEGESSSAVSLDRLEFMLARGDFDLVGIGRALISDPAWVEKIEAGRLADLCGFNVSDLEILV
jgi:2,4-dienoyl-CoA reductase-like NADH-dependent reductase (Old Yellow Enzyme family)